MSAKKQPLTLRERRAWLDGYNTCLDDLSQLEAHLRRGRQDFEDAIATIARLRDDARRRLRRERR